MTTSTPATANTEPLELWRRELSKGFSDTTALLSYLELDPGECPYSLAMRRPFAFKVPLTYAEGMRKRNWWDPLLLQVLPREEESKVTPGFHLDAVGDHDSQAVPGLLHKYASRCLMLITSACAIHCRYCFRQHFTYKELPKTQARWQEAWEYLDKHREVDELILSGGDPLMLTDTQLSGLLEPLRQLGSIQTLRIHTRMPIVLPERIDAKLLRSLTATGKQLVMVVHANHAAELGKKSAEALGRLKQAGILLLNQAVLLNRVNDSTQAQVDLCRSLLSCGVLPYYLHQLDRVQGTSHFEVPIARGREIMEALRKRLPGYALPRYVQEIAGQGAKSPIL